MFLGKRFTLNLIKVASVVLLSLAACSPGAGNQPVATAIPVTGGNAVPTIAAIVPQAPTSSIPEGVSPAVKVSDQAIVNNSVTVQEVDSPGPGWIVIHINNAGAPGTIIGWSPVNPGVNNNVVVNVDSSKATPVLYAMLHVDAGTVGTYEFPGPDVPLMVNGQMINPAFGVTGGSGGTSSTAPASTTAPSGGGYGSVAATSTVEAPAPAATASTAGQATVLVANNPKLGQILVDVSGKTLYIFKKDGPKVTNCTGGCAENWPPLLITSGNPVAGPGVSGTLATINRPDNGVQILYNDQPLYYFAGDQAPGDVNGQGIGNVWFAATP